MVPIAVFHGRKCCCCCGGGAIARTALGVPPTEAVGGAGTEGGAANDAGAGAVSRSAGVGVAQEVPLAAFLRFSQRVPVPVRSNSQCGGDRDCLDDSRVLPSFAAAYVAALAFVRPGVRRFVEIREASSGAFLARVTPSGTGSVTYTPTSQQEFELLQEERRRG